MRKVVRMPLIDNIHHHYRRNQWYIALTNASSHKINDKRSYENGINELSLSYKMMVHEYNTFRCLDIKFSNYLFIVVFCIKCIVQDKK